MTAVNDGYDPLAPAVQADPYPWYARLRAEQPVQFVSSLQAYAVSRYHDVRRVMHDDATFSSKAMATLVLRPVEYAAKEIPQDEPFEAMSIIGMDGEEHTRMRLIVNRGFTPRRIATIEESVRTIARTLLAETTGEEPVDLQRCFAVPLPTIVIGEMLGVPTARRDDFRRWSEHMVRAVFEPLTPEEQSEAARNAEEMGDWLDGEIATRGAGHGGDDLISVLLRAELEGGALRHDELRTFVFTLLVAGSITTAYLIGTAAALLAYDHRLLRAVADDPHRIPAVVEETLRYDAPTQLMFRTATTDVDVAGATIPAGATVLALLGSANRDASVFAAPDRFDPERPNASEHLSFGHGVHYCLGAALARLEARVALQELLARAPHLEPAGEPEHVRSIVFRGPTRLPLLLA
jgi:cytochrome P450